MVIDITGTSDRKLQARARARLRALLGELPAEPIQALVTFTDVNGPKGGLDSRCGMTLSVPRRPPMRAEDTAEAPGLAFDRACEALTRQVERYRERLLERSRHPKKYYVAKTLLAGAPPPRTRAARARRRREG
jgi:ribosome-associated translation inhibitor RaiA